MAMRVSTMEMANLAIFNLNQTSTNYQTAQEVVSSGLAINKPSDNPAGMEQVLQLQHQNGLLTQFSTVMNDATSFMTTSESALSSVTNLLQQARSIAVSAANGTNDQQSMAALSSQVGDIIKQVANLGNTQLGNRYVFSGQRTQTAPFVAGPSGTFTYVGGTAATQDATMQLDVGDGQNLVYNVTGDTTLAPALAQLQQLQQDIQMGQQQNITNNDISGIDTQLNTVLGARSDLGSKIQRMQSELQSNSAQQLNNTQYLTQIQDANIPQAVVNLQTAQTAYQAALQTTSHAFQYSLLNYLP